MPHNIIKRLILICFFLISFSINSQDCKCEKELKFVIDYYEENLPGFMDNVNELNIKSYNEFKDDQVNQSKTKCDNEVDCFKIILIYVEFFKDNHSTIEQNRNFFIDEKKTEDVENFINSKMFKEREVVKKKKLITILL